MQLTDLLPIDDWICIEKEINRRSGLDAAVFDTNGFRITGFKKWANRLCPVIKANDKGQSFICAVAHMNIATAAKKSRQPFTEECDGGLVKACVPIIVDDTYLGALCGCGMVLDDGEVDTFLINKITGIDEEKLQELSSDVRYITSDEIDSVVDYMSETITTIIKKYKVNHYETLHKESIRRQNSD
ncbi:MAG: PocR ligand-binding domain-containing protein [Thermodesulfobacteriota bacterium]